jgi:hypothetical protein
MQHKELNLVLMCDTKSVDINSESATENEVPEVKMIVVRNSNCAQPW